MNHLPKLLHTRVSKFTARAVSSGVCMSHGTAPAAGTARGEHSPEPSDSQVTEPPEPPLPSASPLSPDLHTSLLLLLLQPTLLALATSSPWVILPPQPLRCPKLIFQCGGFSATPDSVQGSTTLWIRWTQNPNSPGWDSSWNGKVLVVWDGC